MVTVEAFPYLPHSNTIVQGIAPAIARRRKTAVLISICSNEFIESAVVTGGKLYEAQEKEEKAKKAFHKTRKNSSE